MFGTEFTRSLENQSVFIKVSKQDRSCSSPDSGDVSSGTASLLLRPRWH